MSCTYVYAENSNGAHREIELVRLVGAGGVCQHVKSRRPRAAPPSHGGKRVPNGSAILFGGIRRFKIRAFKCSKVRRNVVVAVVDCIITRVFRTRITQHRPRRFAACVQRPPITISPKQSSRPVFRYVYYYFLNRYYAHVFHRPNASLATERFAQ